MKGQLLLRDAVILDIETLGLERAGTIHQVAVANLETQVVKEWTIAPNLVLTGGPDDAASLVTRASDPHVWVEGLGDWDDVRVAKYRAQGIPATRDNLEAIMMGRDQFALGELRAVDAAGDPKFPHLVGADPTASEARRTAALRAQGITAELGKRTTMEQLLTPGSEFLRSMEGKIVWIANAPFESKQLGAVEAALGTTGLKSIVETQVLDQPDSLYVSGSAMNSARLQAQLTGDWTGVWKAAISHVENRGKGAVVMDIQDVSRSMMSYGRKLGLTQSTGTYFGTSIEMSYRMLGSLEGGAEGMAKLLTQESHRAAEDAAVAEQYVLRRSVELTEALQMVDEGKGAKLVADAMAGKGLLAQAMALMARQDQMGSAMVRQNLVQRLARAQKDIWNQGWTPQFEGISKIYGMTAQKHGGGTTEILRGKARRVRMDSMEQVVSWLTANSDYGDYGLDIDVEWQTMRQRLERQDQSKWAALSDMETEASQRLRRTIENNADLLSDIRGRLPGMARRWSHEGLATGVEAAFKKAPATRLVVGALATAGLGMGVAGAGWGMLSSERDRTPPSAVTFNYEEWKAYREGLTQKSGMGRKGVAASKRWETTDFGSPYRGPVSSGEVLFDQEMIREREKHLREQYRVRHYDPEIGLFGIWGPFKNFSGRKGYKFMGDGEKVDSGYKGLRGRNLQSIDLSDGYKIKVEDADTVVIKRGGVRGAVASMFGLNRGYSFRLAGVDSPELSHGSTSYHAPQPYAREAAEALRSMIRGSSKQELVFDTSNTTYGRMMGAMIVDGQNVNFEIVRRGIAAHLPYGKAGDAMVDYAALARIEERAHAAQRGMWSQPWAKAFYDVSEVSGNRLTFNTLTKKSRIVQNVSTMETLALMETAQAQGMYNAAHAEMAAAIGQKVTIGADKLGPAYFSAQNAPHKNYMDQMLRDQAEYMKTGGRRSGYYRHSHKGGYGTLNRGMAIDTMGATTSVWTKRRLQAYNTYSTNSLRSRERKMRQASLQRDVNKRFGQSPIGHSIM